MGSDLRFAMCTLGDLGLVTSPCHLRSLTREVGPVFSNSELPCVYVRPVSAVGAFGRGSE